MEQEECPIVAFNELVRGRYKLRILWEVRDRSHRFGALRRALVDAPKNSSCSRNDIAPLGAFGISTSTASRETVSPRSTFTCTLSVSTVT